MCPIVFMKIQLGTIRDRVKSGMANAQAKGVRIGRPELTKDDIPRYSIATIRPTLAAR